MDELEESNFVKWEVTVVKIIMMFGFRQSGNRLTIEAIIPDSTGDKRTITWFTLGQLYHGLN